MVTGLWRKLPRDLWTLRAQTAALAVLVLCGVAVLVSSWSSYRSLQTASKTHYDRQRMADVFADLNRAPLTLLPRLQTLPAVDTVEPRLVEDVLIDVPNQEEPALGRFVSIPADGKPRLNHLYLRQGRMPLPADIPDVLVHEAFAEAHTVRPGDALTGLFRGRRRTVRVTGIALSPEFVYALNPAVAFPDNKHFGIFWMPRPSLEKITSMEGAFNNVVLKIVPGASEIKTRAFLDALLAPYGCLGSVPRSRQLSAMLVADEIRQQKAQAVFNPAVFLLVAAFLIHIVLSRLVALQRPQIATLKSLGYRDWEIGSYYAALAGGMALVGIGPGLLAGAGLGTFYARLYRDFFRFPELPFSVSGAALGVGVLAGLVPALAGAAVSVQSVFRLTPAQALRPAVPVGFRPGLFSDVPGIRLLSPEERLVVRGLFARPGRLTMTVLGIAAAMALVINGGFWRDTLDTLVRIQFEEANREHLTVLFRDPRPPSALRELARWPGVIAVEGFRSVPVRIRVGQRVREISLHGLAAGSSMSRALTPDGNPVAPPVSGIFLSRYFERDHGVRVGDTVELEVMEGGPRRRQAIVTGFTDDLVGNSATLRLDDLHRLMDEPPVFSSAKLRVEKGHVSPLYARLKASPQVAAVHVMTLLYQGFQETIAGMVEFFTWILIGFAVAIAAAVIYNSARVTLSERGGELAGLRVLGFSPWTTWGLLFSEVAGPVFLALLPGAGLGLFLSWLSSRLVHTEQFHFPLRLSAQTYGMGVLVITGTSMAAGIWLWRAVRQLNLVEALKYHE